MYFTTLASCHCQNTFGNGSNYMDCKDQFKYVDFVADFSRCTKETLRVFSLPADLNSIHRAVGCWKVITIYCFVVGFFVEGFVLWWGLFVGRFILLFCGRICFTILW